MTCHKETSAAKHRTQAFSGESTPGVRYFIQIHFRVIFLVSSVSVFGKSNYSGSGQLLAAENREREGNPEPTRGDPERNKGGHLGFCVKVRDLRGEGSVDSGSGHGLISPRESRGRGSPESCLSGHPDNIPRTSEVNVLHCATC